MKEVHCSYIVPGCKVSLQLSDHERLDSTQDQLTLTSNPPMNGATVSGSSGAIEPNSPQYLVRPVLMEDACSAEAVRLKSTAKEFASWGYKGDVRLSRYIPSSVDQKASLNAVFNADALVA